MLIDDVTIELSSGKGGDGLATFDKTKMTLGPTGGIGGNGGNVYLQGVSNIGALSQFRGKKKFWAENGQEGGPQKKEGRNGKDLSLIVPVGTVIHNLTTGEKKEITKIEEKVLICKGGRGGRGNHAFRSPSNTTPKNFEEGKEGKTMELRLELKLIADVGFVGLPNIGKSSLLNELTNAKSRVANYSFTTLEPSLGAFYELILADIPGLIEGASAGKGLGIKFLKHIERTRIFFHFISAQSKDPIRDYKVIRKELENYNKKLLEKKEYILVSQSDMATPEKIKKDITKLKKINSDVLSVSILDDESVKEVKKLLERITKEEKIFSE
ncbi:MAG: GTPase ObgE [Patescibacteria group bacterium]|jgi:GTP-binding protein|nr:GTPase ObgE [Patescibacteria group bacterium]